MVRGLFNMVMHVIQSQLVNFSYGNYSQKHIKLVRWWVIQENPTNLNKEEILLPFTENQEDIFF